MAEDQPVFVAVGKVMGSRGIQGEAFLLPLSDFEERFQDLDRVRLELPDGRVETLQVEGIRRVGKRMAVKFVGVETIEAVRVYQNSYLQVSQDEIHELPEDRFYVFELVGMEVVTASGKVIGPVVDVLHIPGNDVYVVDRNGDEVMLPAVSDLLTVDREAGRIVVQDGELEGLL